MSENNNQSMGDLFPDLGPEVPIISGVGHRAPCAERAGHGRQGVYAAG